MVYPTPGFVVRSTFLEFEEEEQVEEPAPLTRRGRSYSDTDITVKKTPASQFGSEELKMYCEMRKAETPADEYELKAIHEKLSQMFFSASIGVDSAHEQVCQIALRLANETSVMRDEASQTEASQPALQDADMSYDMETTEPDQLEPTSFSSSCDEMPETPIDQCTTVTLSNLPTEYSRHMLVQTLRKEGFARTYDFLFLPMDLRTRTGNGYALVNFHSHKDARKAIAHFEGFSRWSVASSQMCTAAWSKFIQGTDALIERHRNSPIMHEAVPEVYKPAMYDTTGNQVSFPEPTKRIRMPRLRRKAKHQNSAAESTAACHVHAGGASVADRSHGSARQAAGRERRKKANAAPSWNRDVNNDAWFVDLVASRFSGQAMPCDRRAPGQYCSKVESAHYGTPPELMGLGGCEPYNFVPPPGQLVWLMSN